MITRLIVTTKVIYETPAGEGCMTVPGEVSAREAAGIVYDIAGINGRLIRVETETARYRMHEDTFIANAEKLEETQGETGRRGRPRKTSASPNHPSQRPEINQTTEQEV